MGLLGDIYSAIDTKKRQVKGLLDDFGGTVDMGVRRFREDQQGLQNLFANAYPMAGDKTVLNSPQQIAQFQREAADKAGEMGLAGTIAGKFEYPQGKALETAQRNAAKPIKEGGLGLPANNTAMDRAKAMGFDTEAAHFSRHGADVNTLDSGKFAIAPFDAVGTHVGGESQVLDRFNNTVGYKVGNPNYANDELKGITYPVRVKTGNRMLSPDGAVMSESPIAMKFSESADYGDLRTSNAALRESVFSKYDSIPYVNEVESPGAISHILPPKNIRSRFAAFDPARRNESDILGGVTPEMLKLLAASTAGGLLGYNALKE